MSATMAAEAAKALGDLTTEDPVFEERVSAAIAGTELDLVVALSPENFQYLSGVWMPMARGYLDRHNLALWPREGAPAVIVGVDWEVAVREQSRLSDVRTYDEAGAMPPAVIAESLAEAIADRGCERGRIGIEGLRLPWVFHQRLVKLLPDAAFEPCDELFRELRRVKSAVEVEILGTLAFQTDVAVRRALERGHEGMSERHLAAVISEEIMAVGASAVPSVLLGSGERAAGLGAPSDKPMRAGDVVRIDLNSLWRGYYCDLGRMATVGTPDPQIQRDYEAHVAFKQAILERMAPGVLCSEVYDYYLTEAERRDLDLFRYPYIGLGHSIGVNNDEFPKLNRGHDVALEDNMVMNVEPDTIGAGGEVHHVEDMVLVRESGVDVITWSRDWSVPTLPRLGEPVA